MKGPLSPSPNKKYNTPGKIHTISEPEPIIATTCRGMRQALEIVGMVITRWRTWHCHKKTCDYCQSPAYRESRRWRRQGIPMGKHMLKAAHEATAERLRDRGLTCLMDVTITPGEFRSLCLALRRKLGGSGGFGWWGDRARDSGRGTWTLAVPPGYRAFVIELVPSAKPSRWTLASGLAGISMPRVSTLLQGDWIRDRVVQDRGVVRLAIKIPDTMAKGETLKPDTTLMDTIPIPSRKDAILDEIRWKQDLVEAGVDIHPELVGKIQHEDDWEAQGFVFASKYRGVKLLRPSTFVHDPGPSTDGSPIDGETICVIPSEKEILPPMTSADLKETLYRIARNTDHLPRIATNTDALPWIESFLKEQHRQLLADYKAGLFKGEEYVRRYRKLQEASKTIQ